MAVMDLANPTRFLTLVDRVLPWLAATTVLVFAYGLYRVMGAPDDYQQGATVKIMFLHVPAAWLGMMGWGVMTVAALGTLVWRHPLADVAGKAAAPIGAAFTFICLITGSLWGRPMWGTYWVWDARLTSVLVLFLCTSACWRCTGPRKTQTAARAPPPFWRWSVPSIFRSSNSRSIGGILCTSRLRSSAWVARRSTARSRCRCSSWRSLSHCCFSRCI